jgi:hypothetical protein
MARKLRIQYGGEVYHVLSRGTRREDAFEDDQDWCGDAAGVECGLFGHGQPVVSGLANGRSNRE